VSRSSGWISRNESLPASSWVPKNFSYEGLL
jgi:hypothetical protein